MIKNKYYIFVVNKNKWKALEKVNDPADVLIHSKNGKYNAIVPLKRIQ